MSPWQPAINIVPSKLLQTIRLITLALIFVLAGFYASVLLRPKPAPVPSIETTGPATVEPALTLPEFVLTDITGEARSINEFTGRPLLINFWATWCTPCLREMPMFEAIWQEQIANHNLQIVGIAIDRIEEVGQYLEKTGVTYPVLVGQSDAMKAAGSFGPDFAGLPFTVFVSADRQILLLHSGELLREQLDDILSVVNDVAVGRLSVAAARARLAH